MKWMHVGLLIGLMALCLTGVAASATISTTIFPLYVDGQAEGVATPFAVHVTISDWTAMAGLDANVRVTTTNVNLSIWNGSAWLTANQYNNAPAVSIDGSGNWTGWIYVKSRSSTGPIRASARKVGDTAGEILENTTHSVTYMNMSTSGAWIYDSNSMAPDGYAVLAFDSGGDIIGAYAAEDNQVDEGYSSTSGYVKMAVPANTTIARFEARASTNTVYATDTTPGDWESGGVGTTKDIEISQGDLTLPVTLSSFTALPGDGQAVLHWITESEMDNLGFHVYRSLKEDGEYIRVTGDLIQGAGSSPGRNEYSFTDLRLTNGQTYWYELEDVSFDGKHTLHGPIQSIPKSVEKSDEEASEGERPKRSDWGTVKHSME
ncbi:MAG: hypothetical protein V1800_13185 [Candidatus Latescibacterota bacterium]